ncbi:hypothetical protein WI61_24935 [Burkholderia cepacia]|uniref:hypothetical protein n=1 Tax=Burkholderia cepacia TaxID=292 RepID=UPI000754972E|nr:hypothetical protein [Burkholderia cepacia]KVA60533.1 hypothetical protein WI49_03540 [Burkholderia cepacia]KVA61324.1 hypothetical protein WI47_33395 [Burkholderia cepacia]KVA66246.1 hypothetical protein WI48_35705 [Burkholderia cepacia]KVA82901.1 hypothetical protein WI50_21575 [Burkholderia cepacia]KVA95162.1 hypothetical protein WI51_38800 [Burkholderia cepacia]
MNIKAHIFSDLSWRRLIIGLCITGVLSLSVHAVMLQWLHVPYPAAPMESWLPEFINNVTMVWAANWLYGCLRAQCPSRSSVYRVFVLFLLLTGLNETLRSWFMNGYCSTGQKTQWLYQTLGSLQHVAYYALVATLVATMSGHSKAGWKLAIALALGGLLTFAVTPGLNAASAAVLYHFQDWAPTGGWCQLPYGPVVLIPAYLTFIEPLAACLCCVAFAWRQLGARRFMRACQFALLILALKKQLFMSFLYAIYAPMPAWTALLSMGQFTLEAAALGLCMALSWRYANGSVAIRPSRR